MTMVGNIIRLLRPEQWIKNIFVFLPMFFGGKLADLWCWHQSAVMFLAFSCASSAVYCVNDINDIKEDRQHPVKCRRPVACGKISVLTASILSISLMIISLSLCLLDGLDLYLSLSGIIILYIIINIAYSLKIKQLAIIDVFIVSFGFVLRLVCGGISCNVWLSPWIVLLTFLLALLLAFAKRRDDVILLNKEKKYIRKSIKGYTLEFLNLTIGVIAAVIIVCYIMYTVSSDVTSRLGSEYVYVTSLFVLGGIIRYLQITVVFEKSGCPTNTVLTDKFLHSMIICWFLSFLIIMYL